MAKSPLSQKERAIHNEFIRCGRNAKEWLKKSALILPKVERYRIWKKLKIKSIYHYAAVVSGMNHEQTREALRVMRHIQDKPALLKVAEKKGINSVRPVATIATKETAEFWAEKAEDMTVRTLGPSEKYTNDCNFTILAAICSELLTVTNLLRHRRPS